MAGNGSVLARYFGGDIVSKADDVGFVAVPQNRVPSTAKAQVEQLLKIPSQWSAEDVVNEAREAGKADLALFQFKKGLQYRKQRIQAGMATYAACADFAITGLRAAEQAGSIDGRFANELTKHGVTMKTEIAQVQGYEQALKGFQTTMG